MPGGTAPLTPAAAAALCDAKRRAPDALMLGGTPPESSMGTNEASMMAARVRLRLLARGAGKSGAGSAVVLLRKTGGSKERVEGRGFGRGASAR
jgi:hypothetical protein